MYDSIIQILNIEYNNPSSFNVHIWWVNTCTYHANISQANAISSYPKSVSIFYFLSLHDQFHPLFGLITNNCFLSSTLCEKSFNQNFLNIYACLLEVLMFDIIFTFNETVWTVNDCIHDLPWQHNSANDIASGMSKQLMRRYHIYIKYVRHASLLLKNYKCSF